MTDATVRWINQARDEHNAMRIWRGIAIGITVASLFVIRELRRRVRHERAVANLERAVNG